MTPELVLRTERLITEYKAAVAALTRADFRELLDAGVAPDDADAWQMTGIARVSHCIDSNRFEFDGSGGLAFISPILTEFLWTIESRRPERFVRLGTMIDLVAWDPASAEVWLRCGAAEVLGLVPPQYCEPPPIYIRRSVLNWFRSNCTGLVTLSPDGAVVGGVLRGLRGTLVAENPAHAAELRDAWDRPWPSTPQIEIQIAGGYEDAEGGGV